MSVLVFALWLCGSADGFWETKAPELWSVEEVQGMLESSPWAQTQRLSKDYVNVHLATAAPMREAEKRERMFQKRAGAADASFEEYLAMIEEGKYVAVAVRVAEEDRDRFADGKLIKALQRDSEMRIGKTRYPLITHFPPSSSDPYLRLIFARPQALPASGVIGFHIVAPGAVSPHRDLEFVIKNLTYKGKLEY